MPSPPIYDVFLSHGSADEPAVEVLAKKLREAGIEPFLDSWHLVPGRDWQPALMDALARSRACAVFVGSGGLGPWASQEMYVALDRAAQDPSFPVIPVLLPETHRPESIPGFLAQKTWVELRSLNDPDAFHRLLSGIRGEAPGPGLGSSEKASLPSYRSMAPSRETFIHRREYDLVVDALLSCATVGITTAIRGAGGFGKTALAQEVCWDERIRRVYPDGILWAKMKESLDQASRVSVIRELIRWFIKAEPLEYTTATAAGSELRQVLTGKRVLLVVDDAWRSDDVEPFRGFGPGSAVLVTTRVSTILSHDWSSINVDAMASAEAAILLGTGLPAVAMAELGTLASRLGKWPILLGIVSGQLRERLKEGLSAEQAVQEIHEELDVRGIAAIEHPEARTYAADWALGRSLDWLTPKERERYAELAIFPENQDIPLKVLERLWECSLPDVRNLCGRFLHLSLVLRFDRVAKVVRLHAVVRAYLLRRYAEEIPASHRRLLDACCPVSGLWPDLSIEETYLWHHLVYHLVECGQASTCRDLLLDFSYLQAKLAATGVNALLADYAAFEKQDHVLSLVGRAIRLSAHVLGKDRNQLASHLWGRLGRRKEIGIRGLLESARDRLGGAWLRPVHATFVEPGGTLIQTLKENARTVTAVAILEGDRAVSGSDDGSLHFVNLESGETLLQVEGHSQRVSAVAAWGPHRVISCSDDGTLRWWDPESGALLRELDGCDGPVRSLAVLEGEDRAISGSHDGAVRLWDLESDAPLRTLEGHEGAIQALVALPGNQALSGSADGPLRLWNLSDGALLKTFERSSYKVTTLASWNGERAVSGSDDCRLRTWNLASGATMKTFGGASGFISALAVLEGGRAVSGAADGTLTLWDLDRGETLAPLGRHRQEITALAVKGDRAVSASADRTLRLWSLDRAEGRPALAGHTERITAVAAVAGGLALTASADKTLRLWSSENGEAVHTLRGHEDWVTAVAALDGGRAISRADDGTLRLWDLKVGEPLKVFEGHTDWVSAFAVLEGGLAVSGCLDGSLRLWELESGTSLRRFPGRAPVTALAILDHRRTVTGSSDGSLRLWDLESGSLLDPVRRHSGMVNAVAVLDAHHVLSGSDDRTLRLWDLKNDSSALLGEHEGWIRAVAVLNEDLVISGSADGTLRLWNVAEGRCLAVVTLDDVPVSLAFLKEQGLVVVGDESGRVHFLAVEFGPEGRSRSWGSP